jgi:hypothetical protein
VVRDTATGDGPARSDDRNLTGRRAVAPSPVFWGRVCAAFTKASNRACWAGSRCAVSSGCHCIPRLADIRLTGEVPRVRSNFVDGIKHLPVEVTLA